MKFALIALSLVLSSTVFAQQDRTKFCQNNGGYAELSISGKNIEILTKGLGETDGVLSFIKMKLRILDAQWVGLYSDYIQVPIESGQEFEGQMEAGGQKFPAKIYLLKTAKDNLGRNQQILMLGLAGSNPNILGVDLNCK